jgi:hypothetical protein
MEFAGRRDEQVKIRGHRIELGEVEACLRKLPGIRDCAVVTRSATQGKALVAYVVGKEPESNFWQSQIRQVLPQYMVPEQLLSLDELPLMPSGKLDRRKLAASAETAERVPASLDAGSARPITSNEMALERIWAESLQRKTIGIEEDFFDLGGHSLVAMPICHCVPSSRIRRSLVLPRSWMS